MRSWKKPTLEQVDRAMALLVYAEHYRYFFDRLENPEWLKPLWDKGFFKHPPQPVRDKEEGTIRFPPWPEARYLVRMAKHKPELVAKIIREMDDTENASVQSDLGEAALAMPPDISATLVEKALKWAETPYLLLPEKLGALMSHWAQGGKTEEALRLASVLLDVLPEERPASTAEEGLYSLPPTPKPRFDVWHYEQILKKYYLEIVQAAPFPALKLLCNLLDKAIQSSVRQGKGQKGEDLSSIWRPAIEDHPQNIDGDIKNVLVTGIRDAAEIAVRSGKVPLEEIVTFLEGRQWKVFQRISLHLLRIFREQTKELIAPRLTDHTLFEDVSVQHEYILLLRESFSALSLGDQQTILNWIEEGPDIERFREPWQRGRDRAPSEKEMNHYCEIWQRDRLAWIGPENLPEEWRDRYRTLVQQYGKPEHPKFPEVRWVGPDSPKSAEELKLMSVEEIVTFLKTWQPQENVFREPSPEGLGRVLASVVAEDPRRFAKQAERFRELDPTYVRSLFYGLREALEKHKKTFDWVQVLQLCRWVVTQPREIPGRRVHDFEADPDWGWTRKAIAALLAAGFKGSAGEIPIGHREGVWTILQQLTEDPEPTPEYEARYGGSNMDPATLSINTTRGAAMHALIRYALWVRRYLEKQTNAREHLAKGFEEMSEVRAVLEAHLDPTHDPSLAIRAVYGQWFPWLVLLDEQWAREHTAQIFPLNEEEQTYFDAAWNTYVVFNRPYDNVLDLLREQYSHAVERIGHLRRDMRWPADPDKKLAEHLMEFHWRGKLPMDDLLLTTFWEKAPDTLRGHALEFVGRALKQTEEEIPEEIIERLKNLWESRLEQARRSMSPHEFAKELAAFGWWFVSEKFDADWTLDQLIASLQIAGKMEPVHMVLEQLAKTAETHPLKSVECLKMLVEADTEGWELYVAQDHIQQIIKSALKAPNVKQEAERVIHYLGSRGFLDYRNLLKG